MEQQRKRLIWRLRNEKGDERNRRQRSERKERAFKLNHHFCFY